MDDIRTVAPFIIASFFGTKGLTRFFSEVFELHRTEGLMTVSERNLDAFLRLRLEGKAGICTLDGSCGDYLVVEHNGDIFPCDFFVKEAWRLRNLDEGRQDGQTVPGQRRQEGHGKTGGAT